MKRDLLSEPEVDKARRVYEYINRANYAEEAQAIADQKAAVEAERVEDERAQQRRFYSALTDATNRSTLLTLIVVTALMVALPLTTYYLASTYVFASLSPQYTLAYSGFAAVLAVNVVSCGFGVYALREAEEPETEAERDERENKSRAIQDDWVRRVTHGAMVGVGQWNEELKQRVDAQPDNKQH